VVDSLPKKVSLKEALAPDISVESDSSVAIAPGISGPVATSAEGVVLKITPFIIVDGLV
jgi:hypothetical protein